MPLLKVSSLFCSLCARCKGASEASSLLVYINMTCVVYNMHYIIQFFFVICYSYM